MRARQLLTDGRGGLSGIGLLIILAVVGAVVYGGMQWQNAHRVGNAVGGDCLAEQQNKDQPTYSRVDCGSDDARYVVRDVRADSRDCVVVPGTERTYWIEARSLCIGRVDVDPATTINDIQVGECVVLAEPARKVPCGGPGSSRVLLIAENVLKVKVQLQGNPFLKNGPCDGAPGTEQVYGWGLESSGAIAITPLSWDRVLCLGP